MDIEVYFRLQNVKQVSRTARRNLISNKQARKEMKNKVTKSQGALL